MYFRAFTKLSDELQYIRRNDSPFSPTSLLKVEIIRDESYLGILFQLTMNRARGVHLLRDLGRKKSSQTEDQVLLISWPKHLSSCFAS